MGEKKTEFLSNEGLLNRRPERVCHSLFSELPFFDPLDLPQVRYEMLRVARVEGKAVSEACKAFGFSREYFYRQERAFMDRGYVALLGSPMGRRPVIALNQEVVNFITHRRLQEQKVSGEQLRKEVRENFGVECSRRTVERIIESLGLGRKRGRRSP